MKGHESCCTNAHGHAAGTRAHGVSRARGPGVPSLDQDGNKSMQRVSYLVVGCGCRSWWCDRCGPKLGRALRERLLSEVESWTTCIPMTLTLGRWVGDGDAASAWEFVTKREKVRKLMDAIGAKRWVWFLEPQSDGYPHWHVLVDVPSAATREGLAALRRRVWSLWGPAFNRETGEPTRTPGRWDLGIVHIDRNKLADQGPRAVVAYCTSYVTKAGGVAAWMLDAEREVRVRKFGASRSVGALRAAGVSGDDAEGEGDRVESEGRERRYRPLRDRLSQCGLRSQVIRETVDAHGVVRRVYVGELEVEWTMLLRYRDEVRSFTGLRLWEWDHESEDGERRWTAGLWVELSRLRGEGEEERDAAVLHQLARASEFFGLVSQTRQREQHECQEIWERARGSRQARN